MRVRDRLSFRLALGQVHGYPTAMVSCFCRSLAPEAVNAMVLALNDSAALPPMEAGGKAENREENEALRATLVTSVPAERVERLIHLLDAADMLPSPQEEKFESAVLSNTPVLALDLDEVSAGESTGWHQNPGGQAAKSRAGVPAKRKKGRGKKKKKGKNKKKRIAKIKRREKR